MYSLCVRPFVASTLFVLCWGFFISNAFAAAAYYDKSTAGSDTANLSSPQMPTAEGPTGALGYSYDLKLPSGRNGIEANASLAYSSNNEQNQNLVGYGWTLPMSKIGRLNKNGVQSMYGEQFFTSSGYGDLVASSTSFVAKRGDYTLASFVQAGSGWEMKDNKGVTYLYGNDPNSRQEDSANSHVYAWYLTDVTDRFGNNTHYEYVQDEGYIYPSRITYTNHLGTQGIYEVKFNLENRSDALSSYQTGFLVKNNKRIASIDVYISGVKRKTFNLRYGVGVNGVRSILAGITEIGYTADGTQNALPETTFQYSQPQTEEKQFTINGEIDRLVDLNGDGLVDFVHSEQKHLDYAGNFKIIKDVNINKGNLQFEKVTLQDVAGNNSNASTTLSTDGGGLPVILSRSSEAGGTYSKNPEAKFFTDLNGDGYQDIVGAYETYIASPEKKVAGSSSIAATSTLFYTLATSSSLNDLSLTGLSEINADGDKKKDFLVMKNNSQEFLYEQNSSQQLIQQTDANSMSFNKLNTFTLENQQYQVVDLNADGLDDMVRVYVQASNTVGVPDATTTEIWMNKGGFLELLDATNTATYTLPSSLYKGVWNTQTKPVLYTDLNFDGIPDVYSHCNAYLTGSGVNMSTTTNYCIAQGSNISAVDLNGDGLTDLLGVLVPNSTPTYWVRLSKSKADLLEKVKNPFGGETSFEYAPASSYESTNNAPSNKVGFSTWTVKKEVSNDGVGNISTRSHTYEDAYIDRSDVEEPVFAGFGKVTTTEPNGLKKVTYYHQNNGNSTEELNDSKNKIGNAYKQENYTSNGQLASQNFTTWRDVGNVSVPETTISREYDISGNGNMFTTAEHVAYDDNLNKINEVNYKDVNVNFGTSTVEISDLIATDTLSINTTYTNSSENTKLFFPQQKTIKNSDGQILLTEIYKYDNQANGATKGLLTRQTTTASDTSQTEIFAWDNSYGLMLSHTDNRGATTTNIYDSNMLYPIIVTNALGQSTQFEYSYATGKKVRTIDMNNFEVRAEYDGLGRATKNFKGPAGATNLVEEFQYIDTTLPSVRQIAYGSGATTTSRYFFYDGFGRGMRQLSDSFTGGEFAAKDVYHNQMGQVYKETIPYKTNTISRLPESVPETMNVNYTFDDLGRVTQTTNALGTDRVDYKPRQKTVLDKNNHPTQFTYDTDGLIKTVREYNQGQEYVTQYEYDTLGNLVKIIDAEGSVRQMGYDGFNRKVADMLPSKNSSSQVTSFKYATDDSFVERVSPDNITLRSEFDILGRKTRDISQESVATTTYITIGTTTIPTTTFATVTNILNTFVYDNCVNGISRLCVASSSDGVVKSYEYSKEGKMAKETVSVNNNVWSPTSVVTFAYDLLGNLLSRSDGKATTTYDYYHNLVSGITYQSASQASSTKVLDIPVYDFAGRVLSYNRGPLETQSSYDGYKMFRTSNTMSFITSTSSYPFQSTTLTEIPTSTDSTTYFPAEFKKAGDSIYSVSKGSGSPLVWPTQPYYQYGVNNIWYALGGNVYYKYVNWNSPTSFVSANRGAIDNTIDIATIWHTYKNANIATATSPTVDFYVKDKVVEMSDGKDYVQVFQRNTPNTGLSSEMINQCNLSRPYSNKISFAEIAVNSYLSIPLNGNFLQDYLNNSSSSATFISSCMLEGHTIENDTGISAGASSAVDKRNSLKLELNYSDLASSTAARTARSLAETMLLYDKANNKPSVQNTSIKLRGQGLYPEVQLVASDPDNHRLIESEIYVATTSATTTSAVKFGGSASSTATVTVLLSDYPFGFGGQYFISSRVKDEYGAWSGFATSTFTAASSSATNTVRAYCPGKSLTTLGSVNCPNPTFTVKMFDDSILKYSGYQNIFKPQSVKIIIADNVNLANPIKTITQAVPNTFPLGEMAQVSGRDLRLKKNSKYYYKLELTFGWYNGGTQPLSTHTYTQAPYVFYTGDFKIKQNTDYGYDNLSQIKEILEDADTKFSHTIYTYDELSRLVGVEKKTDRTATTTSLVESFVYSPTGKVLTNNGKVYSYADDSNSFAPRTVGGDLLNWDLRGRLASSTSLGDITWSNLDRIKEIKKATTTNKYLYDTEGNRVLSLVLPVPATSTSTTPVKKLFTPDSATQMSATSSTYQILFSNKPVIQVDTSFDFISIATTSTSTIATTTITYITSTSTPKRTTNWLGVKESSSSPVVREDELTSSQATSTVVVTTYPVALGQMTSWIGVQGGIRRAQVYEFKNLDIGKDNWLDLYFSRYLGSDPFIVSVVSGSTTPSMVTFTLPGANDSSVVSTTSVIRSIKFRAQTRDISLMVTTNSPNPNNYVTLDAYKTDLSTAAYNITPITSTTTLEVATTTYIQIATTTTKFFSLLTDHLGSTQSVLDFTTGDEVASTTYRSFGSSQTNGDKTSNRTFTNHQSDELDTGLIYMNARYQSPNYGIFISTDEVTDSLGQDKQFTQKYLHNPQGLNPYSYTQNDPVNKWDPDGRCFLSSGPLSPSGCVGITKGALMGVEGIFTGTYDTAVSMLSDIKLMATDPKQFNEQNNRLSANSLAGAKKIPFVLNNYINKVYPNLSSEEQGKVAGSLGVQAYIGYMSGKVGVSKIGTLDGAVVSKSFFDGAVYTPKVQQQMNNIEDLYHAFPSTIDRMESSGNISNIVGKDGKSYTKLEIKGSINNIDGIYEWIKNEYGVINHRLFRPSNN